ncbi:tumor necrosis factor receptor superfamily member 17 [Lissotriton helveticus]
MARPCLTDQYFDSLLQACRSCQLRCSRSPPSVCQRYCHSSAVGSMKATAKDTHENLWICLGTVLFLTATVLTLLTLSLIFRKLRPTYLRSQAEQTDSGADPNVASQNGTENRARGEAVENLLTKTDETENRPETSEAEVKDCTCEVCGLLKLQTASDVLFPLPATEEGATLLVTTKTYD